MRTNLRLGKKECQIYKLLLGPFFPEKEAFLTGINKIIGFFMIMESRILRKLSLKMKSIIKNSLADLG